MCKLCMTWHDFHRPLVFKEIQGLNNLLNFIRNFFSYGIRYVS